jgi:hypothetical protein
MKPVTIAEILRIGVSGCRVTYHEAKGQRECDRLRTGLTGAIVREDKPFNDLSTGAIGHAIVLELA